MEAVNDIPYLSEMTHIPWEKTATGDQDWQANLVNEKAQAMFQLLRGMGVKAQIAPEGTASRVTIPRASIEQLKMRTLSLPKKHLYSTRQQQVV